MTGSSHNSSILNASSTNQATSWIDNESYLSHWVDIIDCLLDVFICVLHLLLCSKIINSKKYMNVDVVALVLYLLVICILSTTCWDCINRLQEIIVLNLSLNLILPVSLNSVMVQFLSLFHHIYLAVFKALHRFVN